jgi:hypothetical protein
MKSDHTGPKNTLFLYAPLNGAHSELSVREK